MTTDQTIDGMLASMQGVIDFHERCLAAPDLSPASANVIRSLRDGAKAARDAALERAREDGYRRESERMRARAHELRTERDAVAEGREPLTWVQATAGEHADLLDACAVRLEAQGR